MLAAWAPPSPEFETPLLRVPPLQTVSHSLAMHHLSAAERAAGALGRGGCSAAKFSGIVFADGDSLMNYKLRNSNIVAGGSATGSCSLLAWSDDSDGALE